ncbi:MAG: glycosyltransferase family 9 protein [Saprospiraceae bacterium]|nr:glycosyltransferase family 9 protein [Saprospiraceae bacterium]
MVKILIIRFSSIGDIVLTTPVIRCLRQQLGAEIHFLTKKGFKGIVENNPYVERVWTIEKKVTEISTDLQAEKFDYVVDLHKNLRSFQVKRALSTHNVSFNKLNVEKWLMVNFKINRLPDVHIVNRNLATVAPLGIKDDGKGLDYFIPQHDEVLLSTYNIPPQYIAFVIGAAHATKRLPTPKIVAMCQHIQQPIVLLGGKDDVQTSRLIESPCSGKVINLCGKLNLNQSASVVKQARMVISHDTGLMHIAAAFGKDIVSVWGNTIPEFGMTPYLPTEGSKIFEIKNLACRPCSKIGFDKCPKEHFRCMEEQDTEGVVEFVNGQCAK